MTRLRCLVAGAAITAAISVPARAQISLTTAVDLALKNSPRILAAQADVDRARAVINQTRDIYIPSFSLGSGLGYTYGFPFGAPSLFNVTAQSLIFDQAQRNYIHAARLGLEASNENLRSIRRQVMEDTVVTYIALDADLDRIQAAREESGFAAELIRIVQTRLDAGQETPMEMTRSKLTAANLRLRQLQLEDDASTLRDHLGNLTGLPADGLTTDHASIPPVEPFSSAPATEPAFPDSIKAAYSAAQSKLQSAFGDMRKMYRPQIGLGMQYSRLAGFNNYTQYYQNFHNYNNIQIGLQFNLPILDLVKRSHGRESLAEARRNLREADQAKIQFLEGRHKMGYAVRELQARTEVATLERELAMNQIDVIRIQLRDGAPGGGSPVTPKEEQNAHIQERARYLDFLDADLELRQTQIRLLSANGGMEDWLKSAAKSQGPDASKNP